MNEQTLTMYVVPIPPKWQSQMLEFHVPASKMATLISSSPEAISYPVALHKDRIRARTLKHRDASHNQMNGHGIRFS